ncbi:MAG: hemolysin family protein [Alphaproteobacteria bacterium]|nr:hemolysin family protein [Alphaproteobacteria bacterium]
MASVVEPAGRGRVGQTEAMRSGAWGRPGTIGVTYMEWATGQLHLYWDAAMAYLAFDTARLLEPGMIAALTLQVLLFVGSAFFSGSETALFSLSRLDLQKLRRDRHPRSDTLHALLDQPRRLIISILCGNELVNIAATANLAGILVNLYGPERAGWINVLVMFPLLLLFGEITPKTIAVSNPVRFSAEVVAGPLSVWARLITPLRRVVRIVADRITTWIVGKERARENILQVDEFRTLLADVAEEGVLDATERVLIDNLLEAGETEIVEIMTPRTRVKFLKDDMSLPEVVERFRDIKHPRVPVCHEQHDALVGFVHAEDILRLVLDKADLDALSLTEIMHPPVVAPPTKYVDEMFDFFQLNNARAAAVINEFGGVEGFITMRDIVNFIFGEISEGVAGQELYEERDENIFEVRGDMKLTDFDDLTNFGIEDPRMTTIGGVVFRYLDRLPKVGDTVAMDGYVATVLEMDGHRLARVRVAKGRLDDMKDQSQDSEESEAGEDETRPPVGETVDGQEGFEPSSRPAELLSAGDDAEVRVALEPVNRPADVVQLRDLKTGEVSSDRRQAKGNRKKPQQQSEERG